MVAAGSVGACGEVGVAVPVVPALAALASASPAGRPTSGEPLREIFARKNVLGGVAPAPEEESGGVVGGEGEGGLLFAAALSTISCDGISVMLCDFALIPTDAGMGMGVVMGVVEEVGAVPEVGVMGMGVREGGVGSLVPKEGTRRRAGSLDSGLMLSPVTE